MKTTGKRWVYYALSLVIAIGYGLAYWRHEIGISPFHISGRLPGLDYMILFVMVILPLVLGISLGALSGKLKWFVLPLYPVVITLSLI